MARHLIPGDASIKAIRADDPRKRLNDGDGLYLLLRVKGGAHAWRLDYSIHGRRKTLSLGTYPDTSLAVARRKAVEARELVSQGQDPSEVRQLAKRRALAQLEDERRADAGEAPVGSFEAVAREWFAARKGEWAPSYSGKVLARLEADVFPHLGRRPVGDITPAELLEVLRRIEGRGVIETAHRAHESCSQVFRYAVGKGLVASDPARDLKGLLRRPVARHFPAITKPERLAELLRAIDGYTGTVVVRTALRLAPMLLLRPGELRNAKWAEINLEGALWTVPAERMKRERAGKLNGPPHLVPLPRQAVELLTELQRYTGAGPWVFRGERHRDRPMSENTLNAALRAMGFAADEVTAHGFRATARTILAERLDVAEPVIEAQLAHSVRDSLGRAYNRAEFLAQRRAMLATWADYLDRLRQGAQVLPMPARAG